MDSAQNQEPTKEYLVHQNGIIDKGFQELNDELEKKVSDNRKLLEVPKLKSIETVEETTRNTLKDPFGVTKVHTVKEHTKYGPCINPIPEGAREVVVDLSQKQETECVDHYSNGGYICRDVMKAVFTKPMDPTEAFYLCNAFKYLWRCQHKGQYIHDIKKVYDYMGYILQMYENGMGTFQEISDDE